MCPLLLLHFYHGVLKSRRCFLNQQGSLPGKQKPLLNKQEALRNKQKPLLNKQEALRNKQKPLRDKQKPLLNKQKPLLNKQKPLLDKQTPMNRHFLPFTMRSWAFLSCFPHKLNFAGNFAGKENHLISLGKLRFVYLSIRRNL